MLNKKELEQTYDFLSAVASIAGDLLDEIATYEAIIAENKKAQREQSEKRISRKKRAREKRRAQK